MTDRLEYYVVTSEPHIDDPTLIISDEMREFTSRLEDVYAEAVQCFAPSNSPDEPLLKVSFFDAEAPEGLTPGEAEIWEKRRAAERERAGYNSRDRFLFSLTR